MLLISSESKEGGCLYKVLFLLRMIGLEVHFLSMVIFELSSTFVTTRCDPKNTLTFNSGYVRVVVLMDSYIS
jgi:hypothetical protein